VQEKDGSLLGEALSLSLLSRSPSRCLSIDHPHKKKKEKEKDKWLGGGLPITRYLKPRPR
jgi:hypothetical protein